MEPVQNKNRFWIFNTSFAFWRSTNLFQN